MDGERQGYAEVQRNPKPDLAIMTDPRNLSTGAICTGIFMAGFKWTQGRRSDWSRDWQRCHFDLFVKWLKGVLSAILLGFLQDCIRFLSSGRDCVVESHTKLQMPRAAL